VATSGALPSIQLPSEDKELEAILPDEICGVATQKLSLSGASFAASADEEFKATLAQLGKSPSDVVFALAFPNPATGTTCSAAAGIFRVKGADPDRLKTVFLDASRADGTVLEERSVGGKDVFAGTSTGDEQMTFAYFSGDAVLFVTAKDDATAAGILEAMP